MLWFSQRKYSNIQQIYLTFFFTTGWPPKNYKCLNSSCGGAFVSESFVFRSVHWWALQGQGHITVNKAVISIIYIVVHTWPLCSAQILMDGVNPQESNPTISLQSHNIWVFRLFLYEAQESIFKITPSFWEKNSRKSLWYGLSKLPQNRHFERSLLTITLRDPAPLTQILPPCMP